LPWINDGWRTSFTRELAKAGGSFRWTSERATTH
jgi:hypothetical protein